MIGRAAMTSPWIFSQIRASLDAGRLLPPPSLEDKWRLIRDHCFQEIVWRRDERMAMKAMRSRLMAYTRGMPGGPRLRDRLAHVESLAELEDFAESHLETAMDFPRRR
jgi:tRNA-dihydrouridine synthase